MKVLFSTSKNNIISWAIRCFSWSEWSHVEVHVGKGKLLGADLMNGVNILDAENRYSRSDTFLLCEFDVPEEKRQELLEAIKAELGKKYDIAGIFGHLFRAKWEDSDKWFCSELIAAKAADVGCPMLTIFEGRSNRITPRDLLLSTRITRLTTDVNEIEKLLNEDA